MNHKSFSRTLGLTLAISLVGYPILPLQAQEPDGADISSESFAEQEPSPMDPSDSGQTEDLNDPQPETKPPEESPDSVQPNPQQETESSQEAGFEEPSDPPPQSNPGTEEKTVVLSDSGPGYSVQTTVPAGALPEQAAMRVTPVENSEELETLMAQASLNGNETSAVAFHIEWLLNDTPVEPTGPIQISLQIQSNLPALSADEPVSLYLTQGADPIQQVTVPDGIHRVGEIKQADFSMDRSGVLLMTTPKAVPEATDLAAYQADLHVRSVFSGLSVQPSDYSLALTDPKLKSDLSISSQSNDWTVDEQNRMVRDWTWKLSEKNSRQLPSLYIRENGLSFPTGAIRTNTVNASMQPIASDTQNGIPIPMDALTIATHPLSAPRIQGSIPVLDNGNALMLGLDDGSIAILSPDSLTLSAQLSLANAARKSFPDADSNTPIFFYRLPDGGSREFLRAGQAEFFWDPQTQTLDLSQTTTIQSVIQASYDPQMLARPDLEIVHEYEPAPGLGLPEADSLNAEAEMNADFKVKETEAIPEEESEVSQTKEALKKAPAKLAAVPTGLRQDSAAPRGLLAIAAAIGVIFATGRKAFRRRRS